MVLKIPNIEIVTTGIEDMTNAPGGGRIVTVLDPEGFSISFVSGQLPLENDRKIPEKLVFNDETSKPRQRKFQRFHPGPAEVYKVKSGSCQQKGCHR